jgi:hypothetical protein
MPNNAQETQWHDADFPICGQRRKGRYRARTEQPGMNDPFETLKAAMAAIIAGDDTPAAWQRFKAALDAAAPLQKDKARGDADRLWREHRTARKVVAAE